MTPVNVVTLESSALSAWLPNRKSVIPTEMRSATTYSYVSYLRADTTFPIIITGMILEALVRT